MVRQKVCCKVDRMSSGCPSSVFSTAAGRHRAGRGGREGEGGGADQGGVYQGIKPPDAFPCRQAGRQCPPGQCPRQSSTQAAQQARSLTDEHHKHDGAPH